MPENARGLVALCLSQGQAVGASPVELEKARAGVAAAYRDTPPMRLVAEMPWLGFADVRLGHRLGVEEGTDVITGVAALREMRAQVWRHQLQSEDLPAEAQDLAGGIVFTTSREPLPTWQCARPLAFIATMLGDARLTEDQEVSRELARLLASLRFLRQLTADEAECHMYKDPAKAIGGVRSSLFDQRMPPEATAMTLLAVCETLKSLEAIKARQAKEAPAAPESHDRTPPGK